MILSHEKGVKYAPGACLWAVVVSLALVGCVSPNTESFRPTWWDNPHKHDPEHLYFKAEGQSAVGLEQARQEALKEVKAQVSEYICDEVKVQRDDSELRAVFKSNSMAELRGVEVFDESDARSGGIWTVWMLGRYPRLEYNRVRQKMEVGTHLEHLWREAQSAVNMQKEGDAEKLLLEVIHTYDQALNMSFALEAAKLELAGVYAKQNRSMKARQWIGDVQNSAADGVWRRRADALIAKLPVPSVRDAFDGKTVGIYCSVRKDGVATPDLSLTQELNARLLKEQVKTVQSPDGGILGRDLFDTGAAKRFSDAFAPLHADAVLVVVLDVDTRKTGTKVAIPFSNEKVDALDAALRYLVIRVSDGVVLASDSTLGYSTNVTYLMTVILTHPRHLPKYAPLISAGLTLTVPAPIAGGQAEQKDTAVR